MMQAATTPDTRRIDVMFQRLKREGRPAFVTYTVASDPSFEASLVLMHRFVASGIDLIEIGHPFSDPILDGATIQKANIRGLAAGGNLTRTLELCAAFRQTDTTTPLVLMGYANPLAVMGYERFAERAAAAGVDGLIAGDFPLREANALLDALAEQGIFMIPMAAPTLEAKDFTSDHPAVGGFLYCIPVVGPTGGPSASIDAIAQGVARCREVSTLPVMVGFGVKTPKMAADVGQVADGVIVATALIDTFQAVLDCGDKDLGDKDGDAFLDYVAEQISLYRTAIDASSK
ncbi:tryptophan synthase subunit alpha [Pacificibacter marinus]|uniref:Tryptophan synthase alpha chain n=1 Tax=Pacificibacter marinus TaxID=658057 RepID=A0A1Y5RE49_9RHOB|nr:tryptophan synthase subunit alpha [Pacificibacter marinus]SEK22740.1 tryptophan synthase, alpha chain [Pacificibacter marinus]SLN14936.1 Tryptophan synthase alpha chain [Pacificibacter marinus]